MCLALVHCYPKYFVTACHTLASRFLFHLISLLCIFFSKTQVFNADSYTPVQLYLQLRHQFRNCCLLESNDYHSRKDGKSLIGFDPLVRFGLEPFLKTCKEVGIHHAIFPDVNLEIYERFIKGHLRHLASHFAFWLLPTRKNRGFDGWLSTAKRDLSTSFRPTAQLEIQVKSALQNRI